MTSKTRAGNWWRSAGLAGDAAASRFTATLDRGDPRQVDLIKILKLTESET